MVAVRSEQNASTQRSRSPAPVGRKNSLTVFPNIGVTPALFDGSPNPKCQDTLGNILRRKIAYNRWVRLDDTNLVVSVNERSQSDLIKRFEGASVDWTTVENQLLKWASLYSLGKKL
ncbi:hypothetical protein BDV39DRAFT_211392 [Aspergillus sergii]|uniref:Uncharacterized protein n=1 Tax=Aspergillus sergii TaxID=1034303 RepID=A0A5N6WIQ3_9EURO|nr:hypothetical protein BDV39DRAFT_211392 [Aspergillus sergii]